MRTVQGSRCSSGLYIISKILLSLGVLRPERPHSIRLLTLPLRWGDSEPEDVKGLQRKPANEVRRVWGLGFACSILIGFRVEQAYPKGPST